MEHFPWPYHCFKDMALSILPHLLDYSGKEESGEK